MVSKTCHFGNSGLQNHSVGPLYPWTIMVVGDNCQGLHCINGKTTAKFPFVPSDKESFFAAHKQAENAVKRQIASCIS